MRTNLFASSAMLLAAGAVANPITTTRPSSYTTMGYAPIATSSPGPVTSVIATYLPPSPTGTTSCDVTISSQTNNWEMSSTHSPPAPTDTSFSTYIVTISEEPSPSRSAIAVADSSIYVTATPNSSIYAASGGSPSGTAYTTSTLPPLNAVNANGAAGMGVGTGSVVAAVVAVASVLLVV